MILIADKLTNGARATRCPVCKRRNTLGLAHGEINFHRCFWPDCNANFKTNNKDRGHPFDIIIGEPLDEIMGVKRS